MEVLVARFGEIGSKSAQVRSRMVKMLRQRIEDRLEYEDFDYEKVSRKGPRITVETENPSELGETVSEIPGVASCSPAFERKPMIESIKKAAEKLEIGKTFGVETGRAGEHEFDSRDVNQEVGDHILEKKDTEVDLEEPETWIRIDVRQDRAFIFSEKLSGPDGFPVGFQGEMAAMISGGIDSPVAAHEVMKRGCDIVPIYFYNKPVAAEDHLLRFESAVQKLERFNPSKKWRYFIVDMEEVNRELMEIGRGRMVLHRIIMLKTAERIAEKEGLKGIVTGESAGQKSSQTAANLELSTRQIRKPVHRPLLTMSKNEITEKARKLGTLDSANIKSACRTLAPENPATEMSQTDFRDLVDKVDIGRLSEIAVENAEENLL